MGATGGGLGSSAPPPHRLRALAALILVLFALMTVVTSTVSLGASCLTTEPGDVRDLPAPTSPPPHDPS